MNLKSDLKLDWCSFEAAKYACLNYHYSHSVPSAKLVKIGVWEKKKFIGCIIFSRGANNNLGRPYNLSFTEICELTRVALNKHETPVSRILSIAVKMLIKQSPGLKLIISFADTEQEHYGGIYQANNWIYTGLTNSADEYIFKGKKCHGRSIRSVYLNEARKNVKTLIEFLKSIDPKMRVVKGSQKHRYLKPLDKDMQKLILPLAKPYPKKIISSGEKSSCDKALIAEGGALPTSPLQ